MVFVAVLFSAIFAQVALAYRFPCISMNTSVCHCDTEHELIDCNSLSLKQFPPISSRLRGFSALTMAFNNLTKDLPTEAQLLENLPDLQLIDLRGNPQLDCRELHTKFDRLEIHSECQEIAVRTQFTTPTTSKPGNTCTTLWCRMRQSVTSVYLQAYARAQTLWEKLRNKFCSTPREKQGLYEITRK